MPSRRAVRFALLAALWAVGPAGRAAAQPAPIPPASATAGSTSAESAPPLFRIILNDGTALVSFGEFTRVGDRVVFSMPIGSPRGDRLQLVNLPASAVNWDSTARYAESTRYAQYVRTRAEADYAVLTGDMAQLLNEIALTKDPARKLRIAEYARRLLVAWPADHFGYRSNDIREMDALLESTISELRGAAGVKQFEFSLVATVEPPSMPLLPDPTLAQSIDQTLVAARLSDVPAERLVLLRSAISQIDENASQLPKDWARRTRASAEAILNAELEVERRYAELSQSVVERANTAASAANVRGVEQAISTLQQRDKKLGQQRQDYIGGLMALLQERLDAARRLRLMRDQWAKKVDAIRAYQNAAAGPIDRLARLRPQLEDVKSLAGPDVHTLPGLAQRVERVYRQVAVLKPPPDMAAAHATLISAIELGQQAFRTRERAAAAGDLTAAWDASSAAAGSVMMLAQARIQIDAAARPPEMR
jgi:hypothetical protein